MGSPEDIEEEINVGSVQDGEAVEHQDLGVGLRRLVEEAFLEGGLLLQGGQHVVVVAEDAASVVVQDQDPLDGEQRRWLKGKELHSRLYTWVIWLGHGKLKIQPLTNRTVK